MTHPYQSMLDEYKFAIDHLGPTVPVEVKEEAQKMHDELLANQNAKKDDILAAMTKTGLQEYPHRHAFKDTADEISKEKQQEMVVEHVDENVRQKLEDHLKSGVTLEELVASEIFETQFNADERYQIQHGIQDAIDHVREELEKSAGEVLTGQAYQAALVKWQNEMNEMEDKINELENLKDKDPKWKDEIEGKAKRFRGGFLVTEPDPNLLEIKKEIEYWRGTLGEEV